MASVEDVQPVETMWLSPRNPKRMETSLASVRMGMVGMVYTLHWALRSTAFAVPAGWKRKRWSVSKGVLCENGPVATRRVFRVAAWLQLMPHYSLMDRIMKQTVRVWDELQEITVYQKSKSVWVAAGEYMGERIETKASSASAAAKHWQDAARYKGNVGSPPATR